MFVARHEMFCQLYLKCSSSHVACQISSGVTWPSWCKKVHAGANCSVCQSHIAELYCVTHSAKEVAYGERVCTIPYVYTPICMQIIILSCKIRQKPGASQLRTQICLYRRTNQSNNRFDLVLIKIPMLEAPPKRSTWKVFVAMSCVCGVQKYDMSI